MKTSEVGISNRQNAVPVLCCNSVELRLAARTATIATRMTLRATRHPREARIGSPVVC